MIRTAANELASLSFVIKFFLSGTPAGQPNWSFKRLLSYNTKQFNSTDTRPTYISFVTMWCKLRANSTSLMPWMHTAISVIHLSKTPLDSYPALCSSLPRLVPDVLLISSSFLLLLVP